MNGGGGGGGGVWGVGLLNAVKNAAEVKAVAANVQRTVVRAEGKEGPEGQEGQGETKQGAGEGEDEEKGGAAVAVGEGGGGGYNNDDALDRLIADMARGGGEQGSNMACGPLLSRVPGLLAVIERRVPLLAVCGNNVICVGSCDRGQGYVNRLFRGVNRFIGSRDRDQGYVYVSLSLKCLSYSLRQGFEAGV